MPTASRPTMQLMSFCKRSPLPEPISDLYAIHSMLSGKHASRLMIAGEIPASCLRAPGMDCGSKVCGLYFRKRTHKRVLVLCHGDECISQKHRLAIQQTLRGHTFIIGKDRAHDAWLSQSERSVDTGLLRHLRSLNLNRTNWCAKPLVAQPVRARHL